MKIAVVGYGKMGKIIERVARSRGHSICSIDPLNQEADYQQLSSQSLGGIDVGIDFSTPDAVLDNIEKITANGTNLVVGTTGWYDHLDQVQSQVETTKTGFLYASNFSIGVNIFFAIIRSAAKIIDKFDSYDVSGVEFHHRRKVDSPSGTAQTLAGILKDSIARKERLVFEAINRKIRPEELHFASLRCGNIPGTHEVMFDSEADTISLKHTARNREGFALGAVLAAEWLSGKTGFFSIDDLMKDFI